MNEVDLSGAVWRTSSRSSGNGACVEVAFVSDVTAVRDTKDRDGGTLAASPAAWTSFIQTVALQK
ncbi:DUF397 domain-containing protein [Amycolatopsis samaneae]|uniref:DUF397 domain-containing protein n=1 Tax=Amycolatopsis samaneae TaxID=664691 RepID=A0ABW5GTM5_9PSEU